MKWHLLLHVLLFIAVFFEGAFAVYTTVGSSMNPYIYNGDWVVVCRLINNYEPGDVIVYKKPFSGKRVSHRITGKSEHFFATKGDNNPGPDPYFLQAHHIEGKIILVIPTGRRSENAEPDPNYS